MPFDKFGNNYFYPSKPGGFNYEMSDNPKNDTPLEGLDSDFSVAGNIITMKCNGATSFSVGKNGRNFSDSIGGCKMDFAATAKRGYAYKADDVRDLEFKCWMKVPNNLSSGSDGFSMSSCTGHHTSSNCCQGFAYMGSLEGINSNPTKFRFRKETVHVEYTDSSEGTWSHPICNFKIAGHDWIGFGFCRYNKATSGGTSPQDDSVILEIWFNPDPTNDATKWTMLKRTEDKKGRGWTGSKNACNGDSDQIGVWSGAHNRLKSNSTSGTIQFTNISFREIDAFGTFEEPPPGGGGGGTAVQRWIKYAMVSGDPLTYDHFTRVTGHEIIEVITDPDPLNTFGGQAWGNSAGKEVVDPCEHLLSEYADGLDVEPYWSNSDDRCVTPGLTVADTIQVPPMINRKGGSVLANGKIYLIYWGSDWSTRVATPTSAALTSLIQTKMLSADATYFSKCSQYGCSTPTWGGAVFNKTFSIPSHTAITELEGRACIIDTFNKGLLPIPTETNEDVYVLYVPVGKDITPIGTTSVAGGFHDIWHPSLTPPVAPCPTGFHRDTISGACIPNTITCPAGQHEVNGVCVDNDIPVGDPSPPTKVIGTFTLKRDINIYRTDACEGTAAAPPGGGTGTGGTGGHGIIYDAPPDNDKELSDSSTYQHRTRIAEQINKTSSQVYQKVIKQFDVPLKKAGTPAATPTISAVIWDKNNAAVFTSPTLIDPTTLTTSYVTKTFDFSTNTRITQLGDRIGVKYLGTSSTNYVLVGYESVTSELYATLIQYEGSVWDEKTTRDLGCTIYD